VEKSSGNNLASLNAGSFKEQAMGPLLHSANSLNLKENHYINEAAVMRGVKKGIRGSELLDTVGFDG